MTGVIGRAGTTTTATLADIAGLNYPVGALIPTEMTTARSSVLPSAWPSQSLRNAVAGESLVGPAATTGDRRTAPSLAVSGVAITPSAADRHPPDARRAWRR